MRAWNAFRGWLHSRGQHLLCREVTRMVVVGHDHSQELLKNSSGETIDVTNFGPGRPIYRMRRGHG